MATKLAMMAAKKAWSGMIDKSSPENSQLVKTKTKYSKKESNGTYTLQLSGANNTAQGMWGLLSTGAGLTGTNMSMIVIWGLDEDCYTSMMKSFKINGGLSLNTIAEIAAEHCFHPGDLEDIGRFTTLGQVTVRYKVVKK